MSSSQSWREQFKARFFVFILENDEIARQSEGILGYCSEKELIVAARQILELEPEFDEKILEEEAWFLDFISKILDFVIEREVCREKIPGLSHIISKNTLLGEEDPKGKDLLLLWANYHVKNGQSLERDYDQFQDFSDCIGFIRILNSIDFELFPVVDLDIMSLDERVDMLFSYLEKIQMRQYVCREAIMEGDATIISFFLYLLLDKFPDLGIYTVIFTQCIQNDFCRLLEEDERLPCKLHVGPTEALRILGENPEEGPMNDFMTWARAQPEENLSIVHIRDWHDDKDALQINHLKTFGLHCIKNSDGAKLVCNIEENMGNNEFMVNSKGLSDFEGTDMYDLWESIQQKASGRPIHVGVIGVWTDAKVYFLSYDLVTRLGIENLAVCSALCASFSRTKHFQSLRQMSTLLNINVYDSLSDFMKFLNTEKTEIHYVMGGPKNDAFMANIQNETDTEFTEEEELVLRFLFRNAEIIILEKSLVGGFSGARVLLAKSLDSEGYEEGPFVVKLDNVSAITTERRNFEQVENIISNFAPRILSYHEHNKVGGIKFAFASHLGNPTSFMSFYKDLSSKQSTVMKLLKTIFMVALVRFANSAKLEYFDICEEYNFDGKGWAYAAGGSDHPTAVRNRIEELTGQTEDILTFGNISVRHVALFLEEDLPKLKEWSGKQQQLVSYVHGDLNGQNILIDENTNVWLIDFFWTGKFHVLKDIAKMENDCLFQYTMIENEEQWKEAYALLKLSTENYLIPAEKPIEIVSPQFVRAFKTLRKLRKYSHIYECHSESMMNLSITLLRYSLHTACFNYIEDNQRKWAVIAACLHAQNICKMLNETK